MIQEELIPGLVRCSTDSPAPPGWQKPFFYLLGTKNPLLIDTGYQEPEKVKHFQKILPAPFQLQAIILTHGHTDHSGAVKELKERFQPRVMAHTLEKVILQRRNLEGLIDQWLNGGELFPSELGELKMINTPGHSPGHICVYLEEEGILFTGDLVVGEGTSFVGPPDGDMSQYLSSLYRIQKLNLKMMLPGHGPVIKEPEKHLQDLIEHRLLREYQILKILSQAPATSKELVKQIYVGLIHPALYQVAEITIQGHLNKLLKEGKICEEPLGAEKRYRIV